MVIEIVDFSIEHGDFPLCKQRLPEGSIFQAMVTWWLGDATLFQKSPSHEDMRMNRDWTQDYSVTTWKALMKSNFNWEYPLVN